jgi:hypothetical protein
MIDFLLSSPPSSRVPDWFLNPSTTWLRKKVGECRGRHRRRQEGSLWREDWRVCCTEGKGPCCFGVGSAQAIPT